MSADISGNGLKVLVVDDEPAIRIFLRASLAAHGYAIVEAENGQKAVEAATQEKPGLVILDLGLPDMDGVAVTQLIRQWSQTPIIILSVRGQEADKIAALDAGADDYLTKPFGTGELLARMRVALRRVAQAPNEPVFVNGALTVDMTKRLVTVAEHEVQLTPNEYDLLKILIRHAGKVLTHRQLLREVWGMGYETETHLLRVNISNLRRKIESDALRPHLIVTEPGVGYRLKVSEE